MWAPSILINYILDQWITWILPSFYFYVHVYAYQTKAIIICIIKIILIQAVAIAHQYDNLEKAFDGLFQINRMPNTIKYSLNHYTVKCCDFDLWETTTWLVLPLSQHFQSQRHMLPLQIIWARSLTKYGHVLYSGTMLSHLHCLDAFQALHFHHYATEEMLQLWARFVTRQPVKDKVIY